jgi:hypothetical protein
MSLRRSAKVSGIWAVVLALTAAAASGCGGAASGLARAFSGGASRAVTRLRPVTNFKPVGLHVPPPVVNTKIPVGFRPPPVGFAPPPAIPGRVGSGGAPAAGHGGGWVKDLGQEGIKQGADFLLKGNDDDRRGLERRPR